MAINRAEQNWPEVEEITAEEFEWILADGMSCDIDAGGDPATSREYVLNYLKQQYKIVD